MSEILTRPAGFVSLPLSPGEMRGGLEVAPGSNDAHSQRNATRNSRIRLAARAVHEGRLLCIWQRLEAEGLHPILIKGWSTARFYSNPDNRPLGDIDVCFPPDELSKVLVLRRANPRAFENTDYHSGVPDLPDRTWNEVYSRTQLVRSKGVNLRVLGMEDHLRLSCRHLARHGANTRRMLEDIAAILNSLPADFDWDECLRGDEVDSRWVLTVVGLAVQFLFAEVKNPTIRARATCSELLLEIVTAIWAAGRERRPLSYYLRHPTEGWIALRYRWLNPVRAAFHTRTLPQTRAGMALTVFRFLCFWRVSTLVTNPLRRLILGKGRRYRPEIHEDW